MPWYAFDAVDDALDATRNFLLPFSWRRWFRLAIIVFFIGGGGVSLNSVSNVPSTPTDPGPSPGPTDPNVGFSGLLAELSQATGLSPDTLVIVGAVIAVAFVVLILALTIASSVMPFVFVDAIRTNDVRVRGPFKRRFWKGIRLLVFRILVTVLAIAPFVLGVLALILLSPGAGAFEVFSTGAGLAGLFSLFAVAAVLFVVVGLVLGFTNQFVIPVMIATDSGVLPSWRQFWPTLRGQWKQFVVYLLVRFVLQLGVGIATFIVNLVLFAVVSIAALVVGLVIITAFGGFNAAVGSVAGLVALGILGVLTVIGLIAVTLPITIMVQSYFTAYELSVLGAANERFALLPPRPGQGNDGGDDDSGTTTRGPDTGDASTQNDSTDSTDERTDTDDRGFSWGDDSTTS